MTTAARKFAEPDPFAPMGLRMIDRKIDAVVALNLSRSADAAVVVLDNGEPHGIPIMTVSRSTRPTERGCWQLSWFTRSMVPCGHAIFGTPAAAIRSASGGFSGDGQPPHGDSSYRVAIVTRIIGGSVETLEFSRSES